MSNGWQTRNLGDLCEIVGGGTPSKSNPAFYSGKTPWATVRDMRQEIITDTECQITKEAVLSSTTNIIPSGNVVIATRVGLGKVCLLGQDTAINQDLRGIIPRDKRILSVRFLFLWLKSVASKIVAAGKGATVQGVTLPFVKSLQIPLVPLSEQQRIVNTIDEAFASINTARANAERNRERARALFESHLHSIFTQRGSGWVQKKLSEVCAITSTLVDPRKDKFRNLIHVGAGNIESQTGMLVELKTANEERLISGKFLFDESMVLYSKIRPYLMKAARPDFSGLCSADIYPLAPFSQQINRDYLFHLLLSKDFTNYAIQGSARAGMPKVNREHLFEFKVSLPSVHMQQDIAAQLDSLQAETLRLEVLYARKIAAFDELKAALLHKAFAGELTKATHTPPPIIPFPVRLRDISTTDLHAGVLAIAFNAHERKGALATFGHVKAEKVAHMVEAFIGFDLGRIPVKDAAGPNDYPHLMKVEHRARMAGFFDFTRVEGCGYRVKKLGRFNAIASKARAALGDRANEVDRLLELMVPMTTQQAEIISTVYAAWNNILLDDGAATDSEIVAEARDNWHPDKLTIPREKFVSAIEWLKKKNMVPTGKGKRVVAKTWT